VGARCGLVGAALVAVVVSACSRSSRAGPASATRSATRDEVERCLSRAAFGVNDVLFADATCVSGVAEVLTSCGAEPSLAQQTVSKGACASTRTFFHLGAETSGPFSRILSKDTRPLVRSEELPPTDFVTLDERVE
jgi:hypothetical protein